MCPLSSLHETQGGQLAIPPLAWRASHVAQPEAVRRLHRDVARGYGGEGAHFFATWTRSEDPSPDQAALMPLGAAAFYAMCEERGF